MTEFKGRVVVLNDDADEVGAFLDGNQGRIFAVGEKRLFWMDNSELYLCAAIVAIQQILLKARLLKI